MSYDELFLLEKYLKSRAEQHVADEKTPFNALSCTKILTNSIPIALNLGITQENMTMINSKTMSCDAIDYKPSGDFLALQKHLETMSELLKKYKIKISLEAIVNETDFSIGLKILEEESRPEMIPTQIENFLQKYCQEKKIDQDKILKNFLEKKINQMVYEAHSL